ncbi:G-protein coupled receptor Mth-like [Octopus vulgaris]|uniref:G-protein coupled receptor Mth-like n=1 Tax=Octopus vulgaris TaxID=6645 RepID=A0AA36B452_OCTVU|nr:G-protein coupled receptor Mth-like [Octopus vulgaris]
MFQYSKNLLLIFMIAFGDEVIQQSSCFTKIPKCNQAMCSNCSCDKYCYLYNECCLDWVNQTNINQRTLSTDYSCRKIDANNSYFVFDRCPSDYSFTDHVTYCETPDENDRLYNIPALGKQTKRLYRNLFCALCNGEEYILWTVHYKCNQMMDIDLSLFPDKIQNHCQILFEAPSNYKDYKYNCIHYVAKCPPDVANASLVSSCMFGPMAIVKSNGTKFRNTHCAICNGFHINDIFCNVTIDERTTYFTPQYPLTIIFNYNDNNFEVSNMLQRKLYSKQLPSCSQGYFYDEQKKRCRHFHYNSRLNCTAKRLEKSEYYITSDGDLYLNASNILLNQSAFIHDPQDWVNQTNINQRTLSTDYSCRKIDANNSYFVFDRCPSDYSFTDHVTYCETPDENDRLYNIPALGKQTKRLYRNLFCALCNGEEYILWTVHYKCNQMMDIDLSLFPDKIQNHCQILFEAPSNYKDYKYNCIHYVAKCPPDVANASLVSSCMFGPMAIVKSNGTKFRNTHCAICNGFHINDIFCNVTIDERTTYFTPQYPLTIIFNYNDNNFEVSNMLQRKLYSKQLPSCSQGYFYDEQKKRCRHFHYNSRLNCTAKRLEKSEYYITSDGDLYLNASNILLNQSAFIHDPQAACYEEDNCKIKNKVVRILNHKLRIQLF